jgi:hypothetical protein
VTSSEKPERSTSDPQQDAKPTSVITQTADDKDEQPSGPQQGQAETATSDSGEESSRSHSGEILAGSEAPPPWQRASTTPSTQQTQPVGTSAAAGTGGPPGSPDAEDTQSIPRPNHDPGTTPTSASTVRPDPSGAAPSGRTAVSFGASSSTRPGAASSGSGSAARRPSRGPRRASLQVKRVDPWSVLKLSLVLSVALFFVWMIAVAVLYGVLNGMGVWDQLNGTFTELTQSDDAAAEPLISAGRVFGVTMIIGAINIVLITALATVAAFIYNVAADFAGGIEVTLSERE